MQSRILQTRKTIKKCVPFPTMHYYWIPYVNAHRCTFPHSASFWSTSRFPTLRSSKIKTTKPIFKILGANFIYFYSPSECATPHSLIPHYVQKADRYLKIYENPANSHIRIGDSSYSFVFFKATFHK